MSDLRPDAPRIADFESALSELETLVKRLEQGDLSLEQSLEAFERGVVLTRQCQQALKVAEQRVQQLIRHDDGSLTSQPFDTAEDNEA